MCRFVTVVLSAFWDAPRTGSTVPRTTPGRSWRFPRHVLTTSSLTIRHPWHRELEERSRSRTLRFTQGHLPDEVLGVLGEKMLFVGDSMANCFTEHVIQAVESRIKDTRTVKHRFFPWLVEHCADLPNGRTAYQRLKGLECSGCMVELRRPVMFRFARNVNDRGTTGDEVRRPRHQLAARPRGNCEVPGAGRQGRTVCTKSGKSSEERAFTCRRADGPKCSAIAWEDRGYEIVAHTEECSM